ncbi:nucleotidyltransferase [Bacillus sp. FJAT-45350]|uniref:nucleotidyltransferase n=1 Tax=Bacillus sp. FJAT-45350 TaxID=2011014 RepID=UPI000BB88F31|nr:nucleotidyltransferase [Bacillus sp. FJAT-45350]
MKSVGVVVEYNPFHNGHLFHLQSAQDSTNADIVVAVMSGYFLQRGEPALVSKWARTKMALNNGADLVIELPYAYSTQKAETFAYGSVSLLDSIGVDYICFGSEEGTVEPFTQLVTFLQLNEDRFNHEIQQFLAEGNSYPKSCSLAFESLSPSESMLDLSLPNNILGYHYVQSIQKLNSSIKAYTVARKSANYHDETFSSESIASATSIRKALVEENGNLDAIKHVIPEPTYNVLTQYKKEVGIFHTWEQYFPLLKYRILSMSETELREIYEGEEGLEYRIRKLISSANNFKEFMESIKTKRYTWNRLQRYCLHILTNTKKSEIHNLTSNHKRPPYIRLLGMNESGQQYLRQRKKNINTPIISRLASYKHPMLDLDKRAAACYAMGYPISIQAQKLAEEHATPPIRT